MTYFTHSVKPLPLKTKLSVAYKMLVPLRRNISCGFFIECVKQMQLVRLRRFCIDLLSAMNQAIEYRIQDACKWSVPSCKRGANDL